MGSLKRRHIAIVALDFGTAFSKGVAECQEQSMNADGTWYCKTEYNSVGIQWPGQEGAFDMACCGTNRSSVANNNNIIVTRLFGQEARMRCQTKGLSSLIYGLKLVAHDVDAMQGVINNLDQMTVGATETGSASAAQGDDTGSKKARLEPTRPKPYASLIDLVNRSMETVRSVSDAFEFSRKNINFGLITEAIKDMGLPIRLAVREACKEAPVLGDLGHTAIAINLVLTVPEKLKDNVEYLRAIRSGFEYVFPGRLDSWTTIDEAHADLVGLTHAESSSPPLREGKIRLLLNMGGGLCTMTSADVLSTNPPTLREFEPSTSVLSGGELVIAQFDAAIYSKYIRPRLVADQKHHRTCQKDVLNNFRKYLHAHATSGTSDIKPFSVYHNELISFFPMVLRGFGMTQKQIDEYRKAMHDAGIQVANGTLTVQPNTIKEILDTCVDPLCNELRTYLQKVKAKIVSKYGIKAIMTDFVDYLVITGNWRGWYLEEKIRQAVRDSNCLENEKIHFVMNYRKDNVAQGALHASKFPDSFSLTSNKISVGVIRPVVTGEMKFPNKYISSKDIHDLTRWAILKDERGSPEFICRGTHRLSKDELEQEMVDLVERIVWSPRRLESLELGLAIFENDDDQSVRFVDHSNPQLSVHTVGQAQFTIELRDGTAEIAKATKGFPIIEYDSCFCCKGTTLYHSFTFKSGGHMNCTEWNCTRQCKLYRSPPTVFGILDQFSRINATQAMAAFDIDSIEVATLSDGRRNDNTQAKQAKSLNNFFGSLSFRPRR